VYTSCINAKAKKVKRKKSKPQPNSPTMRVRVKEQAKAVASYPSKPMKLKHEKQAKARRVLVVPMQSLREKKAIKVVPQTTVINLPQSLIQQL
jgi:hypothetical protein